MKKLIIYCFLFFSITSSAVYGIYPADKKLNKEKLKVIHEHLASNISNNKIAGAVVLVAQDNKVMFQEAAGFSDIESGKKISKDQVFRLASMSKPVTGTAIMMLIDQGKISLNDPLSKFIPSFKDLKVAVSKDQIVPANREVTIKDLLTHSSGIGQGGFSSAIIDKIVRHTEETLAEYIPELSNVPLDFQPGTKTGYSALAGFDILGRIVEIVSGESLDKFLSRHLFAPLEMKNTGFANFREKVMERIPVMYKRTDNKMEKDSGAGKIFLDSTYFSGAAGLIGTIEDYSHFALMLVNGGTYKGKRILSPGIIEEMSSPQLPEGVIFNPGQSWGLSMRVITTDNGSGGTSYKGMLWMERCLGHTLLGGSCKPYRSPLHDQCIQYWRCRC